MIIPTCHKSKLRNTLSWPLGAEAISTALGDAPHAADLNLWFSDSPVWPASAFQKILRESLPYIVLAVCYNPDGNPGHSGSSASVGSGFLHAQWTIQINPVLRALRAVAGELLRERGLPAVAGWLRSSGRPGWDWRYQRIELVFAPAEGTMSHHVGEVA